MYIVSIVMYTSILRYSHATLGNGSIFRPTKQQLGASTSLSCRDNSCLSVSDAMLQCHMQPECIAAWFFRDGDNNAQCGGCVCIKTAGSAIGIAGSELYMRYFVKRVPGKISHTEIKMP